VSLQILWKTTRKFVLPARLIKAYCVGLTFVVDEGRIRVERDPALCGRLNEEVGHLLWCDQPRDKSCLSCVLVRCVCLCSSFSHPSMEDLFISFWCVDFEKCPSQIY
jgi:hypothetical protein